MIINIICLTWFAVSKVVLFIRPKSCSGHCDKLVTQVTKKRYPLTGPIKRDSLVIGFFAVGATNSSRSEACRAYTALLCGVKRHESERSNLISGRPRSSLRGLSFVGTQTCVASDSQKNLLLRHSQNGVLFFLGISLNPHLLAGIITSH